MKNETILPWIPENAMHVLKSFYYRWQVRELYCKDLRKKHDLVKIDRTNLLCNHCKTFITLLIVFESYIFRNEATARNLK